MANCRYRRPTTVRLSWATGHTFSATTRGCPRC